MTTSTVATRVRPRAALSDIGERVPERQLTLDRSPWKAILAHLVQAINDGTADVDAFYAVGNFQSTKGAHNRRALLAGRDTRFVPVLEDYRFVFHAETDHEASTSTLYAMLVAK